MRKFPLKTVVILGIVAVAIALSVRWSKARQAGAAPGKKGSPGRGAMPVPVVAGTVSTKDVPIYLDGLGTVQAFNTVTVRPRVDGQIEKILFTEGQEVHNGEVLAPPGLR